jgi:hypothetical protein
MYYNNNIINLIKLIFFIILLILNIILGVSLNNSINNNINDINNINVNNNINNSPKKNFMKKNSINLKSIEQNKSNTSIDINTINNINNSSLMQILQPADNNNNYNNNNNDYTNISNLNFIPKFLEDDEKYEIYFDNKYHKEITSNQKIINTTNLTDGKLINFYENEKKEIIYPNGSRKEIYNDGYNIVYFKNKDIKQVNKIK